jgi:hypothetical protein
MYDHILLENPTLPMVRSVFVNKKTAKEEKTARA